MKQRIFISISVPEKIRQKLIQTSEKWQELPIKWTRENKLHLTLLFLGFVDIENLPRICETVKNACVNSEAFDLEFTSIELAPAPENPQLIWLIGDHSPGLLALHQKIEKALEIFVSEKKTFRPHITLGRIRKHKWEALPEKPQIAEKFSAIISADSVDIMTSHFGDDENEYVLLESCPLK